MNFWQIMKRGGAKSLPATQFFTSASYAEGRDFFSINLQSEGERTHKLELTAEEAAQIYINIGTYLERRKALAV